MRWHNERINAAVQGLHVSLVHDLVLIDLLRRMRDDYEQALISQCAESIRLTQQVTELEAQLAAALATIERVCGAEPDDDGALYAEGCAP